MTNVDNSGSSVSKFRYMMLTVLLALMSMVTISCSSDDEEPLPDFGDFYIEFDLSGGGLNEQQLLQKRTDINRNYEKINDKYFVNIDLSIAKSNFKKVVENIKVEYRDGCKWAISGTLSIIVMLKTKEGRIVQTEVIRVTRSGVVE